MAWIERRHKIFKDKTGKRVKKRLGYYFCWYEGKTKSGNVRRCTKSLRTKSFQRANFLSKGLINDIDGRRLGITSISKIGIQDYIPRLESYLRTKYPNKHTQRKYLPNFKMFANFMVKKKKHVRYLHEVDTPHINAFIEHEQQVEGKAIPTINGEIRSLHKMFSIAHTQHGHLNKNPVSGVSIITVPELPPALFTQDEIRLMLKFSKKEDPMLQTLVLLMLQAAPRREEVTHFYWKDFNKENLTLRVSKKDGWSPKHGRERTLKLSYELGDLIDRLPRKNDYIFTQIEGRRKGHPFSNSQIERFIIESFVKKLGIDEAWLHKFRETYASYSLACGVDMPKVQHRIGHKSLKETDKYSNAIHVPIGDDIRRLFVGDKEELKV